MDERLPPTPPRAFGAWLVEMARTWPGLVGSYGPLPVVPRRRRQAALVAFAAASGAPRVAWAHRVWADALGAGRAESTARPFVEWASSAGARRVPVSCAAIGEGASPAVVEALRASVALTALTAVVDRAAVDLVERVRGRRPRGISTLAADAITLAAGAPLVAPFVGWSLAGWALARSAPALPSVGVDRPTEASLLAHLVAEALPVYLGGALARLAVVHSPVAFAVAVRSGSQAVTVRIGRGSLAVADGVADDAVAVLDGELDEVIETVGETLSEALSRVPEREGPSR